MSDATVPAPGPLEKRRGSLTDETRATFLDGLEKGLTVTHAAKLARISRQTLYEARTADAEFAEAWADAWLVGAETLITEARRRGVEGVEEPIYQGGELVGTKIVYSDRMLELLLRAHFPAFREAMQVTLGGQASVDVQARVEVRGDHRVSTIGAVLELARQLGANVDGWVPVTTETVDGVAVELPEIEAGDVPAINEPEGASQ